MTDFTLEFLRKVLFYDQLTGDFTWKVALANRIKIGQKAGRIHKNGYWMIGIKNKKYYNHILAWYYMKGEWPNKQIDHKNTIKNDNHWDNLRLATIGQNKANQSKYKNNTTGYKNVFLDKQSNKYYSRLQKDGVIIHFGRFLTKEEASEEYTKKSIEINGEFARI